MTTLKSVQKVLAVHALFHQSMYPAGHAINLIEHNGDNDVYVTRALAPVYGNWVIGAPWCAGTCSQVGFLAGVLEPKDGSMGAWALTDHLASLPGCRITVPEPGALCSINEGAGHVFTWLADQGGGWWLCGEGNWGDRYQWTKRHFPSTPVHSMARYPGVAYEIAHPAKPTVLKPTGTPPGWIRGRQMPIGIGQHGGHVVRAKQILGMGKKDVANSMFDAKMGQWVAHYRKTHGLPSGNTIDLATAVKMGN